MYAAIRLPASQAEALAREIQKLWKDHETLDIVLISNGCVSIEDDGCLAVERGVVLNYRNANVNAFAPAMDQPDYVHDVYENDEEADPAPAGWDKIDGGAEGTSLEQRGDLMDDDKPFGFDLPCTD